MKLSNIERFYFYGAFFENKINLYSTWALEKLDAITKLVPHYLCPFFQVT